MNEPRYAVFLAPGAESALWARGCQWLGRDAESGEPLRSPGVDGVEPGRLAALTAAPRRYGFHATLKPPMRIEGDPGEHGLVTAVRDWARGQRAFAVRLRCATLGDFVALRPADETSGTHLDDLAAGCLRAFDRFRRAPGDDELAERRRAGLTPRQDSLLERWGYPYVLEEFRFHLSLTGRIEAPTERSRLRAAAARWFAPALAGPVAVQAISVFREPAPGEPFELIARAPLATRPVAS